jgi:lipopolysaccharide export LptBFGC system permease protein LptF
MLFVFFMLLTVLPTMLVLWAGLWLIPWAGGVQQNRRWILFLLITG